VSTNGYTQTVKPVTSTILHDTELQLHNTSTRQ